MKNIPLFLSLIALAFVPGAKVVDRIGIPGPITYYGTKYYLKESFKGADGLLIQMYLKKGEKRDSFKQGVSVQVLSPKLTLKEAIDQKTKELDEKKKRDKTCHYQVTQSPDGKECVLDFLIGQEAGGDYISHVEFNVHRYVMMDVGNNTRALVVFGFSKRAYGADIPAFLRKLKTERPNMINQIITAQMPVVHLNGK